MADKPNDPKKKVEEHHDENLSDSDCSVTDIECETCGTSFTSVKNYGAHMQGKKHLKKVAEAKLRAKNLARDGKKGAEREHDDAKEDDDDEDSEQMHCEVCDKSFTGYISYAGHIRGSLHAKNLKKEKLKEQLKDMPEVIHGESDEDDDFLIKPYAKCGTCQKQFSGPESLKMHMKSAAHQKKVKQSGALQKLKSELPEGSDDDEFYKKCDTCQKSFSGFVPYKTHMHSNVHKKNLERKKVAEEIKAFCANEDGKFDDGYVCKECKKSFTDPLAFKSHLENNSHEKLKAKEALKELLNAHPEIQFVVPFKKEGPDSGSDSEEEADSKYYLICKLCHASFSGPESAQDHVKSKKHLGAKKEKKILKLLKEQRKENSAKASDAAENSRSNENDSASANAVSAAEDKSKNGHVYSVDDFEMI